MSKPQQTLLRFTAEQFKDVFARYCAGYGSEQEIVDAFNAKLQEWLEQAPKAFRYNYARDGEYWGCGPPDSHATHSARLVDIREIEGGEK